MRFKKNNEKVSYPIESAVDQYDAIKQARKILEENYSLDSVCSVIYEGSGPWLVTFNLKVR